MSENELATKKDFNDQKEELLQRLVNKDEFDQRIATLATKEELDQEIATLSTKDALEVVANEVARNTVAIIELTREVRYGFQNLRQEISNKFETVMKALNGIAKELADMRAERLSKGMLVDIMKKRLKTMTNESGSLN
jgi:adenosyl cobinamide kinase/adenosyl cobinamide phosphate guanylyltransferase